MEDRARHPTEMMKKKKKITREGEGGEGGDGGGRWYSRENFYWFVSWMIKLIMSHVMCVVIQCRNAMRRQEKNEKSDDDDDDDDDWRMMVGGVVVVTGVTTGIGKSVVEMMIQETLLRRDVNLICGVRPCSAQKEKMRLDALVAKRRQQHERSGDGAMRVVVMEVDLSVRKSIEEFARAVQQYSADRHIGGHVSLLINNAAEFPGTTREASVSAVTVNVVAPAMLIELLQPMRCCNVVSFTHRSVGDSQRWMTWARSWTCKGMGSSSYGPAEVYMNTKFALVLLSVYYAKTCDVVMFDPGAVDTMLTRSFPPSLRALQRYEPTHYHMT